jgi:DNA polymerase-1
VANRFVMLIIDADTLLYQALNFATDEVDFGDGEWSLTCDHKKAWKSFQYHLERVRDTTPHHGFVLCFTSDTNFRKEVLPTYKASRANTRKPLGYKVFRARVMDEITSIMKDGLEADDCVGILGTMKPGSVMWSDDKDLKQIPGRHVDSTGFEFTVTPEEGERFFLYQTLVGDQVDNYSGCPGIGPKKAESILNKSCTWAAVVNAYTKECLTEEDALIQARVARILRDGEFDRETRKPILWRPSENISTDSTSA